MKSAWLAIGTILLSPSLCLKAQTPASAVAAKAADGISTGLSATVVQYGEKDVLRLKAKLRYSTLIVLPKSEQILDFTCGDKDFWIVNGTQNFVFVKPARINSETNLNLITASGNVYSFVLKEVSALGVEPDLKVFVELKEAEMAAANASPRFVPTSQVEDYRQQVEIAKEETEKARKDAENTVERELGKFRADYPTALKFSYHFDRDRKPFQVTAIYHDDRFTYIRASPQETPALYEIKDGTPNLVNFEYRNGTYIVGKILDSGYLAIGKARLNFTRQE